MCNTSEKEYLQETTIDLNGDRKKGNCKNSGKSNEKSKIKKSNLHIFVFFFPNTFGNSILN